MRYIQEFSDPNTIKTISGVIRKNSGEIEKPVKLMEVCGTHTMSIGISGIRSMLPENIRLISGPGCPVCVTPSEYISEAIRLAGIETNIIVTFGDLIRVPNSRGETLGDYSSDKVKIVYSPLEALSIAKNNPKKDIVFMGVGFETTAPVVAEVVKTAWKEKINNFFCFSSHKVIPPALKILASDLTNMIDGFILPGHVSVIIGVNAYSGLNIRGVVTGFEPVDILEGINMLLVQIVESRTDIENQYKRAVTDEGNIEMQKVINDVFSVSDTRWRGVGCIPQSGLKISGKYNEHDAFVKFGIDLVEEEDPKGCRCGDVLKGKCEPDECDFFGNRCVPGNPVGPCMVSSEGACKAYYKYGK